MTIFFLVEDISEIQYFIADKLSMLSCNEIPFIFSLLHSHNTLLNPSFYHYQDVPTIMQVKLSSTFHGILTDKEEILNLTIIEQAQFKQEPSKQTQM